MTMKPLNTKEERRKNIHETVRQNPMLTDSELANLFSVSQATIRLDRQALGIPEMRKRIKNAIQKNMISVDRYHGEIEILQLELNRKGLALITITSDMVDNSGYVPAEKMYGVSVELAKRLIGNKLDPTQVGNIKYKTAISAGKKLVVKMKVARVKETKEYIYIVFYDREHEVFRAKFIADIAVKGR